jgi:hypothetical protein
VFSVPSRFALKNNRRDAEYAERKTIFAYPWGGRELFYSFTLLPFYFILLCAFAVDLKKNNRRDAEHAEKKLTLLNI